MPTITLMTSYMHQRNGDLVSAISFMKAVLAKSPTVKFEWIIKRDINSHQKDLNEFLLKELGEQSKQVNLTILNSRDYNKVTITQNRVIDKKTGIELSANELKIRSNANWGVAPNWYGWQDIHEQLCTKDIARKFTAANAIVVIGNPHRLIKQDHQLLHKFGKKIIIIPEYSLTHINNKIYYKDDLKMATGFDDDEQGVYIDSVIKSLEGFERIDENDHVFLRHLLAENVVDKKTYHATTELFYGYFFDDESVAAKNFTVKIESYIQNVIMLAIDRSEKLNIDIVIPGFADAKNLEKIYERALQSLPEPYRMKIMSAQYHAKDTDNFKVSFPMAVNESKQYIIRLINPERLQRSTVQALLNESDPFIGLTGDSSWIEGLMKGKITCYQTMQWKSHFFYGFLQFLSTKFTKDSPLYQFYKLQAPNENNIESRWNKMREIYVKNNKKMLEEAQLLSQYIEQEKDINKNLIPEFIALVLAHEKEQKPADTLLQPLRQGSLPQIKQLTILEQEMDRAIIHLNKYKNSLENAISSNDRWLPVVQDERVKFNQLSKVQQKKQQLADTQIVINSLTGLKEQLTLKSGAGEMANPADVLTETTARLTDVINNEVLAKESIAQLHSWAEKFLNLVIRFFTLGYVGYRSEAARAVDNLVEYTVSPLVASIS